jgi:hypothetical protein
MRRFLIFSLLAVFILSACSANESGLQGEGDTSLVTVYRSPT